jgi:hypothetical protein
MACKVLRMHSLYEYIQYKHNLQIHLSCISWLEITKNPKVWAWSCTLKERLLLQNTLLSWSLKQMCNNSLWKTHHRKTTDAIEENKSRTWSVEAKLHSASNKWCGLETEIKTDRWWHLLQKTLTTWSQPRKYFKPNLLTQHVHYQPIHYQTKTLSTFTLSNGVEDSRVIILTS